MSEFTPFNNYFTHRTGTWYYLQVPSNLQIRLVRIFHWIPIIPLADNGADIVAIEYPISIRIPLSPAFRTREW
jgi:hypothetical protein